MSRQIPFEPEADFILFELLPQGETAGGIALPEGASESETQKLRVLKVGPGRVTEEGQLIPPTVKPGDVVYIFPQYHAPIGMVLGGKRYILARNRDVVGKAS